MSRSKSVPRLAAGRWVIAGVWIARVVVGVVFVTSGLAKLIDLWGTVFKIEDYLTVWSIDVPRTLVMIGAMSLAMFEFIAGLMLLTGCYRRMVTWLLTACMLFMLPLTAYIWYADPVEDCGCFGDFIILSNSATFWKNVVLLVLILFLVVKNRCASALYKAPIQWLVVTVAGFYCLIVALAGYTVQPMVDFRPYAPGQLLVADTDGDSEASDVKFIYSRDGVEQVFDADELPDEDDGWEFVDRLEQNMADDNRLAVFDPESGLDVTDEYLTDIDSLLILVISEPARADLSNTYIINELADAVTLGGAEMVALLATDERGIERWKDHSMASYTCLTADDTQLKQLSRGVMSMVWVSNDTVRWKRTVASISLEEAEAVAQGRKSPGQLVFDGRMWFNRLTLTLVAMLAVIYLLQTTIIASIRKINKRTK